MPQFLPIPAEAGVPWLLLLLLVNLAWAAVFVLLVLVVLAIRSGLRKRHLRVG